MVKEDVTSKSTLYLLDAEDQLSSIKLLDQPKDSPFRAEGPLLTYLATMQQPDKNQLNYVRNSFQHHNYVVLT